MPNVRRVRIPQEDTVDRALHRGVVDLLPEQLAENELVRWVVAFDGALQERSDTDDEHFLSYGGEEKWFAALLGRMASGVLQSRIPFYFASVFHIGRMMIVATESIHRIESLQSPTNLGSAADNIKSTISSRLSSLLVSLSRDSIQQILLDGCDKASTRQRQQVEVAERWWRRWQSEVRELRDGVRNIEEGWRFYNESTESWRLAEGVVRLWHATTTKALQAEMARTGIRFRNLETPETGVGFGMGLHPLVVLAALAGRHHPEFWHFELQHFMRDLVMQEFNALLIHELRSKYNEANPFTDYSPGRKPADKQLIGLIQENLLWNNQESPWLDAWRRSLTTKPFGSEWVGVANIASDAGLDWLEYADSAIKTALIHKRPAPGEAWSQSIQRRFEEDFVTPITIDVREWMRSSAAEGRRYSAGELADVFADISRQLNEIGYQLLVPPLSLIRRFLGEATESEREQVPETP